MRIAVLIPVYNAATYLSQCLDSVLSQNVPGLEVFCCDDGSTDASALVLADYVRRDPRVHVVTQANGGVVAARNRLLDDLPAEFESFAFLDSDDYVSPGMYAKLLEAMERTGADVAECEWSGPESVVTDFSAYLLKRTSPGQWVNVINKLYRRDAAGNFRFRAGLSYEEDYFYNYEVHQAIRRKVLVPGRFYTYRDNPASATSSLDLERYFDSTAQRVRLSLEIFLAAGRIPKPIEPVWRAELAKDAYRMCLRKNLKKNRDSASRRELFLRAADFFSEIEREFGFAPVGLNPVQRALYAACRARCYGFARVLAVLT